MQREEKDKEFLEYEARIANGWGLGRSDLDGPRWRDKICIPSSLNSWSLPPLHSFKINFDGAAKGNPGAARFGGVCRNVARVIMKVFFGYIGNDTNNYAELEGLI